MAAFKAFDIDDTGSITKDNLKKVLTDAGVLEAWSEEVCQEVIEEVIDRFDTSGSGEINIEEWKEMMREAWAERALGEETDPAAPPSAPVLLRAVSTKSCKSGVNRANLRNNTAW